MFNLDDNQKDNLNNLDLSSVINNNALKNPLIDNYEKEISTSKESQTPFLNDFLIGNNNIQDTFINYMINIFTPKEINKEENKEEDNNIYTIQSNKKIKINSELDVSNQSFNIFTKINKNQELTPYQEDYPLGPNPNLEKSFISKKRKNTENNINEYDNTKKNNSNSLPTKNLKNKTKDTYDNTYKNKTVYTNAGISEQTKALKYQYRLDYYKKAFKVHCFKHLTKFLNYLLSKCNFPKEFKNKKIFKPNNESFTSNAKEEDNYKFLYMSLKDIFTFIKNDKQPYGISLQKSNKKFIDMILNYIELKGKNYSKDYDNLKKYLNMTMEEYITIYYDTEEFKKFCADEKIQFYEKEFIKEKKFAMLEKCGFLRLIKMYKINNNKNFSNGLKSIHLMMNGINSV